MNILIAGCTVLPMTASEADAHKYFTGNIGIADGRIAFAGADPQQAAAFRARCGTSLREIDGRGKVAMPGLVNLHNHVSMSLMRSYADDMALMEWLNDHIWPFEARQTDDDIRVGALLGAAEMMVLAALTHIPSVSAALTAAGLDTFASIPFLTGYTAANLPIVLYIYIGVTGIGFTCYFLSMEVTSAQTTSLVFFFKPALAPLLAFLLLHEAIPSNMLAGIACILCGSLASILPGLLAQRRAVPVIQTSTCEEEIER